MLLTPHVWTFSMIAQAFQEVIIGTKEVHLFNKISN